MTKVKKMEAIRNQIQPPRLTKPVRITEQVWPEGTVPVVSVFNWAYNHVEFIRESIESILMQETTFPVEIIIHDDASSDGTTEIVRNYEKTYPKIFRNIIQEKNQWSKGAGVMRPLNEFPRGQYLALTHGDDFWLIPSKLEMQFLKMENTPKASMITALAKTIGTTHNYIFGPKIEKDEFYLKDFFDQGMHTSTYFIRRNKLKLPTWALDKKVSNGDVILQVILAQEGPVLFSKDIVSCYRIHSKGVWSGSAVSQRIDKNQTTWEKINSFLNQKYARPIRSAQIRLAKAEARQCVLQGKYLEGIRVFLVTSRRYFSKSYIEIIKWFVAFLFWPLLGMLNRITPRIAIRTRLKKLRGLFAQRKSRTII